VRLFGHSVVLAVVALLAGGGVAHADECRSGPANDPFVTCFDPGNRLVLHVGGDTGGAHGYIGGSIHARGYGVTDDPTIYWGLDHDIAEAIYDGEHVRGALYRGRFLRHSRDGHIVVPTSPPRKLFLPFDIGAEAAVGSFDARTDTPLVDVGLLRAALVLEVTRSGDLRKRLVFGVAGRWDVTADLADGNIAVPESFVSPFSLGVAGLHLESSDGLHVLDVELEAGPRWSSVHAWGHLVRAQASYERVLIALDDHPLSLFMQTGWEDPGRGAWALAGARFVLAGSRPTRR
jgi:hypothetical protein